MAVNQQAIDRLRLDEAFPEKMLHRAFRECWTVRCDERLLVVDDADTKVSHFGTPTDDAGEGLMVINENRRQIVLLSIDNQLLKSVEGGVADCALFDDSQFRFVEFKMNAEGKSDKAIEGTFEKATQQLKNTILLFKNRLQALDVDFEDAVTLRCHVVLSQAFPATQSTMQDIQLEFANETGIPLDFASKTHWEII